MKQQEFYGKIGLTPELQQQFSLEGKQIRIQDDKITKFTNILGKDLTFKSDGIRELERQISYHARELCKNYDNSNALVQAFGIFVLEQIFILYEERVWLFTMIIQHLQDFYNLKPPKQVLKIDCDARNCIQRFVYITDKLIEERQVKNLSRRLCCDLIVDTLNRNNNYFISFNVCIRLYIYQVLSQKSIAQLIQAPQTIESILDYKTPLDEELFRKFCENQKIKFRNLNQPETVTVTVRAKVMFNQTFFVYSDQSRYAIIYEKEFYNNFIADSQSNTEKDHMCNQKQSGAQREIVKPANFESKSSEIEERIVSSKPSSNQLNPEQELPKNQDLDKTELGLEEKSDNKTESISKPMEKSGIGNQKGIIIGIIIGIIATVAIIALISRGHVKNNEFSTNSEI